MAQKLEPLDQGRCHCSGSSFGGDGSAGWNEGQVQNPLRPVMQKRPAAPNLTVPPTKFAHLNVLIRSIVQELAKLPPSSSWLFGQ